MQILQGLSWADAGGPAHQIFDTIGLARPGRSSSQRMGRAPARPFKCSEDGPRPGPAHQIFRGWAAARPSPSHFQKFTARPIIFSNASARPGPANHAAAMHMRHGLYMGRPDNYVGRPVDLMGWPKGRPMCCLVLKGACAYADVIFYVNCCFCCCFSVWIPWDSWFRPMRNT